MTITKPKTRPKTQPITRAVTAPGSGGAGGLTYPSARYWRVNISSSQAGAVDYHSLQEIEMAASPGGADQTTTGSGYSASSDFNSLSGAAAFDNDFMNPSNAWAANNTNGAWIAWDFGSPTTVAEIRLTAQNNVSVTSRAPKDFTLESSSDGMSWNVEKSFAGVPAWSAAESRSYSTV